MYKNNNSQNNGKISLQKIEFYPECVINPGYQKKGRALSYYLTQNYIVDKNYFLDKSIAKIIDRYSKTNSISILEPGCGPGNITAFSLLGSKMIQSFKEIDIECADLSNEMTSLLNENIKKRENEINNSNCTVNVGITSGVSLIDTHYYENMTKKKLFDVVLLSQFKHYFPNSDESYLAKKLRSNTIHFMIKDQFIHFIYDFLIKEKGMLIIIDDEENEDQNVGKMNDDKWDQYVAINLNKNIDKIRVINKEIADRVYKKYNLPGINPKDVAGEIRRYRREQCNEEIRPLSTTISSLKKIFGEENVEYFRHEDSLLSRFYLVIAYKQ